MKKYEETVKIIKKNIPQQIREGNLRLPSELALCQQYGVSRQTIRKALSILTAEKLVESRRGSGTYLTGLLPNARDNRVVLLLTSDTEYIYPELISDIGRTLSSGGIALSVLITGGSLQRERELLLSLLANPPRGLLAEGCRSALPSPNADLYQSLRAQGTSLMFLFGTYPNLPDVCCVREDNEQAAYELTLSLLRQQHRHIAGIFASDTVSGRERYWGYLRALRAMDAPLPAENVLWFDSQQLYDLQKKQDTGFLQSFLRHHLMSCTALLCHNDEIAYWMLKELSRAHLEAPRDLSVVGFGSSYLRHASAWKLSTMTHAPHELGVAAGRQLLALMKGQAPASVTVKYELLPGNTDRSL